MSLILYELLFSIVQCSKFLITRPNQLSFFCHSDIDCLFKYLLKVGNNHQLLIINYPNRQTKFLTLKLRFWICCPLIEQISKCQLQDWQFGSFVWEYDNHISTFWFTTFQNLRSFHNYLLVNNHRNSIIHCYYV